MGISVQDSIATAKTAGSDGAEKITLKESCDIMRDCVRSGTNKIEVARALKAAGVSNDDISQALSLSQLYYNGASDKPSNGPVDLGNPAAAMNKYTQVDKNTGSKAKDDMSQNGCGAGCLVNASLLHGKEGVLGLIAVMDKRGAPGALTKEWKEKAENNKLTLNDLRDMQAVVHQQLLELKKDMKAGNSGTQLVPCKTLEAYVQTDTGMIGTTKPLVENMKGSRILFVSTTDGLSDANGVQGSHFVFAYGYDSGKVKVADTWPRQDGNQVADAGVYINMSVGYIDSDHGSKY